MKAAEKDIQGQNAKPSSIKERAGKRREAVLSKKQQMPTITKQNRSSETIS